MFSLQQHFASLGPEFYSEVQPQPLHKPQLAHINQRLADDIGAQELVADSGQLLS